MIRLPVIRFSTELLAPGERVTLDVARQTWGYTLLVPFPRRRCLVVTCVKAEDLS